LGLREQQTIEFVFDDKDREKLIIFEKEKAHV